MTIMDALLLQKRELDSRLNETYVRRDAVIRKPESGLIKAVIGPRRAGKSFFSIHTLRKSGSFGYANFDDEKLIDVKDYNEIIDAIKDVYGNPKYILFDEVQNLKNWELFVNRLQRQGYNITITGSNSNLLSKELATHLTGRHTVTNIFPFSFKEFLSIESKELTESEIKAKLFLYAMNGGYPEPIVKQLDHKDYISTLFVSIIYKDIVKRFRIRSVAGIENLANYLISNVGKEFSYRTLTQITKCKSVHTIEKYLGYLEEAFIFFTLKRFSPKVKEQAVNKKIYCIDNGFITAKAFKLSPDIGRLYENTVAVELKKMELDTGAGVFYWKSSQQEEVDFVVKRGMKIHALIQVCYNTDDKKTKEREIRALIKASHELRCNNLIVITDDYERETEEEWFGKKRKIRFVPMRKWLVKKTGL